MIKKPLLSVCMITYGHEDYIQQAIEGVLMQQTSFDFELVIANDGSKDRTDAVIKEMLAAHKDGKTVRYFSHEQNRGMYDNFLFALNECKSKYIALCEGDDYWTDPLKLQKQVDFLEANSDYEVCFTNIEVVDHSGKIIKEKLIPSKRITTFEHRHLPIWAPTLTRVFKNRDFSNAIPDVLGIDTIMLLYQSTFGKIKLLHEITGAYRLHEGGVYSSKSAIIKKEAIIITLLESLKLIDQILLPKYFGLIFKKAIELKSLERKVFKSSRSLIFKAYKTYFKQLSFKTHIKICIAFIILFLPIRKRQHFFLRIIDRMFIYEK